MTRLALFSIRALFTLATTFTLTDALKYDAKEIEYNLNRNKTATNPLDYWGDRKEDEPDFEYTQSPKNWRFPFYTVFVDRWINGDPENDNINGTLYETDIMSNQLRFGGDVEGIIDSLDYIQGQGVKVRTCRLLEPQERQILTKDTTGNLHCRIPFYQPTVGCGFVLGKFLSIRFQPLDRTQS